MTRSPISTCPPWSATTRRTARWSPSRLTRVPNPLEFGIIIVDEDGRIQRFLEKPTWGQVFSDTVNTGIYVMEPEVLAEVPAGRVGGLVGGRVPAAAEVGARRCTAGSPTGTGRTSAATRATSRPRPTCCPAGSRPRSTGSRCRPGCGSAREPRWTPRRCCPGRCASATTPRSRPGPQLREFTVVGSNVVVKEGAFLHRAVVHNNVYVGQGTTLRGCVIGKNTDVMALGPDRGGRGRRGRVRDRAGGLPVRPG